VDEELEKDRSDTVPEMMREQDVVDKPSTGADPKRHENAEKVSSNSDPFVSAIVKKKREGDEDRFFLAREKCVSKFCFDSG